MIKEIISSLRFNYELLTFKEHAPKILRLELESSPTKDKVLANINRQTKAFQVKTITTGGPKIDLLMFGEHSINLVPYNKNASQNLMLFLKLSPIETMILIEQVNNVPLKFYIDLELVSYAHTPLFKITNFQYEEFSKESLIGKVLH